MSGYKVIEQRLYQKAYKKLSKSYNHIDTDVKNYLLSIKSKEDLGVELRANVYKPVLQTVIKTKEKVQVIDS